MKRVTLLMALTILTAIVAVQSSAQPGPAGRLPAPGPDGGPRRQALQQVNAYNGQVGEWTTNDDFIYDGFYLQSTQGKFLVKFPAHMGDQLLKTIKKGNAVTVNGVEEINPAGEREIRLVNLIANGKTIVDAPPATLPDPSAETQTSGSGKITAFQKNREGEVNGYILDEKIILRVPPHVNRQLDTLIAKGSAVSYSGIKKSATNGEASSGNYTIIHCQTITVNGTQYMIR